MFRRASTVVALTLAIAGCTAEAYKESADRQVYHILDQRKQETLGYKPEATADSSVKPVRPTAQAYKKIPTTPQAPARPSPMEPARAAIPFGRVSPTPAEAYGPQPTPPERAATQPTSPNSPFGVVAAERNAATALRLGPPPPEPDRLRLGLFDSILYGTQHGRDYQTQMEDLYLQALDVTLQRHLFEPRPFAGGSLTYTGGQADVAYRSALTATANAGVRQQLPYGGNVTAQALVSFIDAINGNVANGETAQLALSASIPLLRGAGLVNLEPLIASERRLIYEVRSFEDFRRQFAVNVATQYFNLIALQKSVINRRVNYNNLLTLTEQTMALYAAGRINFLGVQRSLQAQLFAESDLVNAQTLYAAGLDNFKILLGMPINQPLDVVAEELDVAQPDLEMEDSEGLALKYRLDLKTAEDQIDDARRLTEVRRNGLLPDLNLVANANVGNRATTPAAQVDTRTGTYSAGLNLDLPVDRVAERNEYRASLIALERADRNFRGLRDQVIVDVRDSIRTIYSAQTSLAIQQRNTDLAQRRLEYSYELLKLGAVDSRDVVESQQSLLSAQDSYDRALSALQIAVLRYLRNTGTLRVDPAAGILGLAMDRVANRNKVRVDVPPPPPSTRPSPKDFVAPQLQVNAARPTPETP